MSVIALGPAAAEALYALRQRALLAAPLAFGSAPDDDRMTRDFLREALTAGDPLAFFGHAHQGRLDGMVGVLRSQRAKTRHRADIYSMFVDPEARGAGVGRALLEAAIAKCRSWKLRQVHLSVTAAAEPARRLYESAGFVRWGTEPEAICWQGELVDEHHLVLVLTAP